MVDELERFFGGHETRYDLLPRTIANRTGRRRRRAVLSRASGGPDVVIVGGGAAACVLAARLSEDPAGVS